METRAKAGGQIGMNGERYKGGQFLPSTTLPKGIYSNRQVASAEQKAKSEAAFLKRLQSRKDAYEKYQNDARLVAILAKCLENTGETMPIEYQREHAYGLQLQDERNQNV